MREDRDSSDAHGEEVKPLPVVLLAIAQSTFHTLALKYSHHNQVDEIDRTGDVQDVIVLRLRYTSRYRSKAEP